MKKLTTLLVAAAAAMYFTGCGDAGTNASNGVLGNNTSSSSTGDKTGDKTGDSDTEKKGDYDESVEFADELPKCTAKKDGKVYYVEEEKTAYTCNYDEDLKAGEWVKEKKKAKKPVADETIDSKDDLPNCTAKKDGDIYYIEDDDAYFTCDSEEGEWIEIDTDAEADPDTEKSSSSKGSSVDENLQVTSLSNLPTCKSSLEFVTYYVLAEDEDYTCYDGLWWGMESGDTYPETEPSSSSNGGGEDLPEINTVSYLSSLPTCTSRIENTYYYVTSEDDYYTCYDGLWWGLNSGNTYPEIESSSSSTVISTAVCGDMWCGPNGDEQILTGVDAGDNKSGWWWEFNDQDNGGASYFSWPTYKGNEFSDESFEPIIDVCGGMCGDVTLDNGLLDYNWAGIGFNVSGEESYETANVSSWLGICVVYSSDAPISVEMGIEDEAYYGNDVPKFTLVAGTNKVKDILWSSFEQAGWVDEYGDPYPSITGTAAASALHSLKFKFSGTEGTYSFNIKSIGTYGSCQ